MIDAILNIMFWGTLILGFIGMAVIVFIFVLWYLENKK